MEIILPTREEIHAAYQQGEEAVQGLFATVNAQVEQLALHVQDLHDAVQQLRDQVQKNSRNSSKPPSSDGLKKPRTKSLRKSGQHPNGGQPGHPGHTLRQVDVPDRVKVYTVQTCQGCQGRLDEVAEKRREKRQVFDIPALHLEVTEHQCVVKVCPHCGTVNRGEFPGDVSQPTQYGPTVKAHAAYLTNYQHLPLDRTAQLFDDVFGQRVSAGVILGANVEGADRVAPSNDMVKQQLIDAAVTNFDESGLRVEGKGQWLHVASTPDLTYYEVHEKRGRDGMDAIGILPEFHGTAVHDHWKSYFTYTQCNHGLCNAHHLRELEFVAEQYQQSWAEEMGALLREINEDVKQTGLSHEHLDAQKLSTYHARYEAILEVGFRANPPPPADTQQPKKRGKRKQSPPKNLLDRLQKYKTEVLRFMVDFRVPFDNNQGERDIRMMKVKQKVSGTFRTKAGAEQFCQIRGYISTARKQGVNVLDALKRAFQGRPFIPDQSA
jgi:transposase